MAISQQDYFLKQGESIPDYNTRIAGLRNAVIPQPAIQSTFSVASDSLATKNIASNVNTLNKAESALTQQDYYLRPGEGISDYNIRIAGLRGDTPQELAQTQSVINQPAVDKVKTILGLTGNPAMDAKINEANSIITTTGNTTGVNEVKTAEQKELDATAKARMAQDNEDYLGLKTAIDELKTAQTERQKAINDLITQQAPLREQYIKSLVPGAEEKNLQVQLSDLRANIDQTSLNAKAGINKVSSQAIPQGFVTGQSKAIANAANLTLETQALQEKNLLTRLGIETSNRQATSEGIKAGLGFLTEDIGLQMKAQDRLDTQQQNLLTQFDKYSAQQKKDAADILTSLAGIDPSELSSDTILQLTKIAQQRGISLQDVLAGLQLQHDQLTLENAVKTSNANKLDTSITEVNGRKVLINNQSGEAVKDLGAVTKSESTSNLTVKSSKGNEAYVNAFNNAVIGLSMQSQKIATQTFNQYMESNDLEGARAYLIRIATQGMPAADQTQTLGRAQATSSLNEIKALIKEAKDNGAGTNIISGSLVNISQNLGTSTDLDLNSIGVRIEQQLQTYRRSMTGVAFSPQEAKEYAKIFPDITNVESLNTVKIDALLSAFDSNNRAQLSFLLGGDANYNAIFGKASAPKLPSKTNNLKSQVNSMGFDYDAMRADNISDEEIKKELGL